MPRKLKVVVAHHEPVLADTLTKILTINDVEVVAAYSGVSGLELALSTNPDVAILCIVPAGYSDLNGVYAAVVVRALMPTCKIALVPGGSGGWVTEPLTLATSRGYDFDVWLEPIYNQLIERLSHFTGGDIEPIGRSSEFR